MSPDDPLNGHKAYFGIVRVNHDIGKESSIGVIYTDREMDTVPNETQCTDDPCIVGSNRVGGIDAKFKFSPKWSATFQALGQPYQVFRWHSQRWPSLLGVRRSAARGASNSTRFTRTRPQGSKPTPDSFAVLTFVASATSRSTAFDRKGRDCSGMDRRCSRSITGTTVVRVSNGLRTQITASCFAVKPALVALGTWATNGCVRLISTR